MNNVLEFLGQHMEFIFFAIIVVAISIILGFILYEMIKTSTIRKRKKEILRRALEWKRIRENKLEPSPAPKKTKTSLYAKMLYLRDRFENKK